MSLSQALNQFAQNLGRYPIEPDRCHIRIADDWRFRKIYENVIFR